MVICLPKLKYQPVYYFHFLFKLQPASICCLEVFKGPIVVEEGDFGVIVTESRICEKADIICGLPSNCDFGLALIKNKFISFADSINNLRFNLISLDCEFVNMSSHFNNHGLYRNDEYVCHFDPAFEFEVGF